MLESTLIASRVEQFHVQHGSDAILIGTHWLYSDGAVRERNVHGALVDPPKDPFEQSKLKCQYWQERLSRARAGFDELKSQLHFKASEAIKWAMANAPPDPPTDAEIEGLKALADVVVEMQAKLDAARNELNGVKPEYLKDRERRAAENADRNRLAQEAIHAIKV